MRYVGGKTRIAKWVSSQIQRIDLDGLDIYIEPFLGSGASFVANSPLFKFKYASDIHEDLMLMWKSLQNGWVPPDLVTKEEYIILRKSPPSDLRGFAGFAQSWSGKWFGGYVDTVYDKHWDRITLPYGKAGKQSLLKVVPYLENVLLEHCSYNQWEIDEPERTFIYCDPPYANSLGYNDIFDSIAFWNWATTESEKGTTIVVSESTIPNDLWIPFASRERKAMLKVQDGMENDTRQEHLLMYNG